MKKLKITQEQYDRLIVENSLEPSLETLMIVDINNEYYLVNKSNKQIESFIGNKNNIKDKKTLCAKALDNLNTLFETNDPSDNIYKDNGKIIGDLTACKKGNLQEISMGKKIKLTKLQYDKLLTAGLINESVNVINNQPNGGNIKNEVKELIKYLYRKSDELSPFWEQQGLTYDDIIESLLAKKLIISKNGKYELSKKLGSPQSAIQSVEDTLNGLLTHKPSEVDIEEETNSPAGADEDPSAPWNETEPDMTQPTVAKNPELKVVAINDEIAILNAPDNALYVFNYYDIDKDNFSEYASVVRHYVGKDEDGQPEYEYDKDDFDVTDAVIGNYINDNLKTLSKGEGINDFESNVELVKIDDELKQYLIQLYDKNKNIVKILGQITEADFPETWGNMKDKLAKSQVPSNKIPQSKILAKLGELKAKEQARRDIEKADHDALLATGEEIDEMTGAGASSTGGSSGPFVGQMNTPIKRTISGEEDEVPVVAETDTSGGVGAYDANALPGISRDGTFKETKKAKAEKVPQWAGGSFVKQPECSKLNNNKEAQNGGCNSGANSLKTVKASGSVNAPSLGENNIYETIANKTGKTIEAVKRIIESKNNKAS